jgi:hypothetical protein
MRRISAMAPSVASSAGRIGPSRSSRTGVMLAFLVLSHCST